MTFRNELSKLLQTADIIATMQVRIEMRGAESQDRLKQEILRVTSP